MKTIYDLNLHERISTNNYVITRVPGGWIYSTGTLALFVPYDSEFAESYNIKNEKENKQ